MMIFKKENLQKLGNNLFLFVLLIVSIFLTGYKYYYFLFEKTEIQKVFINEENGKNENVVNYDDLLKIVDQENLHQNIKINFKNNYFIFKDEKIYFQSFKNRYPILFEKIKKEKSFEISFVDFNGNKELIYLAPNDSTFNNSEKIDIIGIEFENQTIEEQLNSSFFSKNTIFRNLGKNNEIEKLTFQEINNFNNQENTKRIFYLQIDKLTTKYIQNVFFDENLTINKKYLTTIKELDLYKTKLSNDLLLVNKYNKEKNINEQKKLFLDYGLKYNENYSFIKNKNLFIKEIEKIKKEKINDYLKVYNL